MHASSEMMMATLDQIPPSPTTARSDSQLASIPPIPPKSKPFLPPKQTINKSKEDVDRLNKVKLPTCEDIGDLGENP